MKKSFWLFILLAFLAGLGAGWYFWSHRGTSQSHPPGLSVDSARSFSRKVQELVPLPDHPRTLEISESEINSFLHFDFANVVPPGVRDVQVKILEGSTQVQGRVNFEELPLETGGGRNPLVRIFLKGEHELAVAGTLACQVGKVRFEIEQARFDQGEIPKPLLDLILARLFHNQAPELRKNRAFTLPAHIEKIALREGKVEFHLVPPSKPSG